ncbi:uncharacterized protein LOC143449284 [Clavelina lepadiformis]|uniref:uncharacterized protein LOC143449284 n=1 Tax=Clavelina lepadiformis TaxID=159417 RepID=UPI0040412990
MTTIVSFTLCVWLILTCGEKTNTVRAQSTTVTQTGSNTEDLTMQPSTDSSVLETSSLHIATDITETVGSDSTIRSTMETTSIFLTTAGAAEETTGTDTNATSETNNTEVTMTETTLTSNVNLTEFTTSIEEQTGPGTEESKTTSFGTTPVSSTSSPLTETANTSKESTTLEGDTTSESMITTADGSPTTSSTESTTQIIDTTPNIAKTTASTATITSPSATVTVSVENFTTTSEMTSETAVTLTTKSTTSIIDTTSSIGASETTGATRSTAMTSVSSTESTTRSVVPESTEATVTKLPTESTATEANADGSTVGVTGVEEASPTQSNSDVETSQKTTTAFAITAPDDISTATNTNAPNVVTDSAASTTSEDEAECNDNKICTGMYQYCQNERCQCEPKYLLVEGTCTENDVQTFGGILYLNTTETSRKKRATTNETREEAKDLLTDIYGEIHGFYQVQVAKERSAVGWNYIVVFNGSKITAQDVQNAFEDYLNNNTNCTNTSCQIGTLLILKQESIEAAGVIGDVVCIGFSEFCDSDTTQCTVGNDTGQITCECMTKEYKPLDTRTCIQRFCSFSNDCNPPYGQCDESADGSERCACSVGFQGQRCKDATVFVVIIVVPIVVFLVLVAGVVYYMKRKKRRYKYSQNSYHSSPTHRKQNRYEEFSPLNNFNSNGKSEAGKVNGAMVEGEEVVEIDRL